MNERECSCTFLRHRRRDRPIVRELRRTAVQFSPPVQFWCDSALWGTAWSAWYVIDIHGQMVHPITCQLLFLSACPYPNCLRGGLPRWFCVTNHLSSGYHFTGIHPIYVLAHTCMHTKITSVHTHSQSHTHIQMGLWKTMVRVYNQIIFIK